MIINDDDVCVTDPQEVGDAFLNSVRQPQHQAQSSIIEQLGIAIPPIVAPLTVCL